MAVLSLSPHMAKCGMHPSGVSYNPSMRASHVRPINPQRPHLQIPSHWESGYNTCIWGSQGHELSVHSSSRNLGLLSPALTHSSNTGQRIISYANRPSSLLSSRATATQLPKYQQVLKRFPLGSLLAKFFTLSKSKRGSWPTASFSGSEPPFKSVTIPQP